MDIKGYSGESLEGSEDCGESFYHLNIYVIKNWMLVEIWMLRVILVKAQMNMRNILESVGKMIFILKWQKSLLNCVLLLGGKQKI